MGTLSIIHCPLSIGEAFAQDSRNRVASTIIADGLAQLPAQNLETLEQVMSEIAGTGAEGVQSLAAMLEDVFGAPVPVERLNPEDVVGEDSFAEDGFDGISDFGGMGDYDEDYE